MTREQIDKHAEELQKAKEPQEEDGVALTSPELLADDAFFAGEDSEVVTYEEFSPPRRLQGLKDCGCSLERPRGC